MCSRPDKDDDTMWTKPVKRQEIAYASQDTLQTERFLYFIGKISFSFYFSIYFLTASRSFLLRILFF